MLRRGMEKKNRKYFFKTCKKFSHHAPTLCTMANSAVISNSKRYIKYTVDLCNNIHVKKTTNSVYDCTRYDTYQGDLKKYNIV